MENISSFWLMVATHFKKVSSSFNNRNEETSSWSFSRGTSSHSCLIQDSGCSTVWTFVISFYDAPNVFYWWKVWTADRPVQHLDSSPVKLCCCDGCSMWFSIVLLIYPRSSLKTMLYGCCCKTSVYSSALMGPFQKCKLSMSLTLKQPHTIRDAGFWAVLW